MGDLLGNLFSFVNSLPGATAEGLIWGIMAIGVYITFRLLDISDLTVDGSFCTGGAVCAAMLTAGAPVWVAMFVAFLAGMLTGLVTGFLHTRCRIPAILAGILTQIGLWTVNYLVMNSKSTMAIIEGNYKLFVARVFQDDVIMGLKPFYYYPIFSVGVFTAAIIALLYWFFGTERGASIRATGANENMARAQGINTNFNKLIGLMLANGLVALSGALLAQYKGSADINMGRGAIVIGLASVIIGEVIFGRIFKNFALKLASVSLGAIVYYIVIQAVISLLDVDSQYMKLFSAIVVALFLTIPNLRSSGHPKHHTNTQSKEVQHA